MPGPLDVAAMLAAATRDLRDPDDLDATLHTIVTVARDSIPSVDHVGISLAHRDGTVTTTAASDDFVVELDLLQYDMGEGPCLHAMGTEPVVRVEDVATETRWPRFMPEAVRRGVRSQMGVRLYADAQTFGALNLYSVSSNVVTDEAEQLAELFAMHVALVLGQARRVENLNTALASRKVIGLALGLVMERHSLDEDTAFAYLTRLSATTETKLRDVAADLVEQHHTRVRSGREGSTTSSEREATGSAASRAQVRPRLHDSR
ncbi:MAG: GAF and ANTAR domain-containing protein [Actinobacteria bacterium]|nr:GAF and ANTAR domain-containing protein [Actinomycetota bacterium]